MLETVVGNRVDNAHQHGGGVDVNVAIELRVRDAENLILRVADDGPGISAANRDRIFDAFFTTALGTLAVERYTE